MSNSYTYIPPFTVSAEAINLIAQISVQIERYAIRLEQSDGLRLRKANRIKTIHSSLAIEGNKLTEGQVSDIIEGKKVVAPLRDIQEVKNAIAESSRRGNSGPFIDFMLGEILRTLKSYQGESLDDGTNVGTNVGENERKILSIIAHTPQATAREMAGILGITLRQCERILASLKQKGLIARVGANKGGHWKIRL